MELFYYILFGVFAVLSILCMLLLTVPFGKLRTRIMKDYHMTPYGISFEWWTKNQPVEVDTVHDAGSPFFQLIWNKKLAN